MTIVGELISEQWQVQWREQLLGWPATDIVVTNVTGWRDLPNLRSTPTDRPGRHGSFPSILRSSYRTIEVDIADLSDDGGSQFYQFVELTSPGEDDDVEPLVIYMDGQPLLVYGRCEKRAVPTDRDWSNGYRRATFSWNCYDPRKYGIVLQSQTIGLANPGSGGLVFPLTFPLTFGTPPAFGQISALNQGAVPTWPTLVIKGPVTGPIITNTTTGDQLSFDPSLFVGASDTLTISTDPRTVDLNGVNYRSSLWVANWFPFLPGAVANLQFGSVGTYDPGATLTAQWRDAWL